MLMLVKGTGKKEGVMISQDYLFMALLMLCLLFSVHWGDMHRLGH
jgi:hypothetical protein